MTSRQATDSQLIARFEGRVQGVGFRFTTQDIARGFSVTGYVANVPDGSVQLVAEGDRGELQRFLQAIQTSQLGDHIYSLHDRWGVATGRYRSFSIQHALDYPP